MAQLSVFSSARNIFIKQGRCSAGHNIYMRGFSMTSSSSKEPNFDLSPVPRSSRTVRTAAALIIGDEVLNGKTRDSNSQYLARFCFTHGIELKRIEVIPDDSADIIESARRLTETHDLVITSGGIGPTHDDITYESLSNAFSSPLSLHSEALRRLDTASSMKRGPQNRNPEQQAAFERMALLPAGPRAEVLFVRSELGVPIVRLDGKLHVLPGVPTLFERLLDGLTAYLALPPPKERPLRVLIQTALPESGIAPYLTSLQARVKGEDIRVGSYPKWGGGVHVSIIGHDHPRVQEIAKEVESELDGKLVHNEGEDGGSGTKL